MGFDQLSAYASLASAIATWVAAAGVWYARSQLRTARQIAQLQFEDSLTKEYRDLAARIPTKALLGDPLNDAEHAESFDEFFRYVDLSNEQVSLRMRGRISEDVWKSWNDGIQSSLSLPAFTRAWTEIKCRSKSFQELRWLEEDDFTTDPLRWSQDRKIA